MYGRAQWVRLMSLERVEQVLSQFPGGGTPATTCNKDCWIVLQPILTTFNSLDHNKDGLLTKSEFMDLGLQLMGRLTQHVSSMKPKFESMSNLDQKSLLWEQLCSNDKDDDGIAERTMNLYEFAMMFTEENEGQDGKITLESFLNPPKLNKQRGDKHAATSTENAGQVSTLTAD